MQGHRYWGQAALVGALLLTACGGKGDGELMASAKVYLNKKDYKAATIQLKTLLQTSPSSPEARFLLGAALLEAGDASGAEIELRRAAELKHPQASVAPLRAKALLKLGQYKKVTDQFAAVELADKPAAVDLHTSVAAAFAAQGAADSARAAILKALALAPDSIPALIAYARIKAAANDIDGAVGLLDELLAKTPTSFEAWQLKGDLLVLGRGNPAGAIDAYKKALAIRSDQAQLHASLISLYFVQQDQKAALDQFEELNKALPGHPLTRFYEAQITFARGDYKRTRELLQDLMRAAPDNASVLHIAGAVELQLNSLAQAESYLSRAVQLQPQFMAARRLLAKVHLRSKQPAKALATLRPVLDRPGIDAETLTLGGQAYLLNGDANAADKLFARAAELRPGDVKVRASLAMSQLARGNADAAFSELQAIAAADRGVAADMALISARMKRNELDAALKAIDGFERKQPENPTVHDLRARVFMQRKDSAGARKSFEKALALDPAYLPAAANLAALDMLDNKPDAAKGRLEGVLKADPKSAQALLGLAEIKRRTGGSRQDVAKLIVGAVNANPTDREPRLVLIEHHLSIGDFKAALTAAQAGVAAIPNDPELLEKLGRTLMASGDMNQANSIFGKLAAQQADSPLGFQGLADVAIATRDPPGAAKNAKRALELAPGSLAAQRAAIIVAMQQKRPQEALAVARTIQTQHPNDALGVILEGEIEADQKRWDAAVGAFRKAAAKPNPAQAPARVHYALLGANKAAEAASFAHTWAGEHPKDGVFLLYLAESATVHGDAAQAEKLYRQVITLQPNNAVALNNVAWLLIKQKRPGAVALAERAVTAAPGKPALIDTLAMALASENQHAKAIELQRKVVAQSPDEPAFRLTLAKIYLQSGDKNNARTELEALARLNREFPGRDEVAPLIQTIGSS